MSYFVEVKFRVDRDGFAVICMWSVGEMMGLLFDPTPTTYPPPIVAEVDTSFKTKNPNPETLDDH
jgi:hypothetical protein